MGFLTLFQLSTPIFDELHSDYEIKENDQAFFEQSQLNMKNVLHLFQKN
ncbi:hypothetical protein IGJ02_002599 [Enterococcus sp. DIV0724b]